MPRPRSGSALRIRTMSTSSLSSSSTEIASGPPSPTFTATTNASQVNLGPNVTVNVPIITRRDLRQSLNAYEDLVADSEAYRVALVAMSNASSRFAATIERCSRLKGVEDEAGIGLQAVGGFHHLIANHWQVLGMSILNEFEDPLRIELEAYKKTVSERSAAYERTLIEKSKTIRRIEAESVNTGRRKTRDLKAFRNTLAVLQAQVDELDRMKGEHYHQIAEHEADVWDSVLEKAAFVVRSSLEVFDRLTAKGTDPILEPLMQAIPDPFDVYGPPKGEDEIFSILPPLAIASKNPRRSSPYQPSPLPSPSPPPPLSLPDDDTYDVLRIPVPVSAQSWLGSASGRSTDWTEPKSAPAIGTKKHTMPSSSNSSTYSRNSDPPSIHVTDSKFRLSSSSSDDGMKPPPMTNGTGKRSVNQDDADDEPPARLSAFNDEKYLLGSNAPTPRGTTFNAPQHPPRFMTIPSKTPNGLAE